jgi:hypothetical protein
MPSLDLRWADRLGLALVGFALGDWDRDLELKLTQRGREAVP